MWGCSYNVCRGRPQDVGRETTHGITYWKVLGRPEDVILGRPQDVIFQRPKDVGRGRPQDVGRGGPLVLHRGPYGTSIGRLLGTSSGCLRGVILASGFALVRTAFFIFLFRFILNG